MTTIPQIVLAKLKGGQDPSLRELNLGASPKMNANQIWGPAGSGDPEKRSHAR